MYNPGMNGGGAGSGSSKASDWDEAAFFNANSANVQELLVGNEAGGMAFAVLGTTVNLSGINFFWKGGHGPLVIKVSLWDTTPTRLTSMSVSVNALGIYTATFSAAQALTSGKQYRISRWETGGLYDVFMDGAHNGTISGGALGISDFMSHWHYPGWFFYRGCYATGDTYPGTLDASDIYGITPIFS